MITFKDIYRYLEENRWNACLDNRSDAIEVAEGLGAEFGLNVRDLMYLISRHMEGLCLDEEDDLDLAARLIADQIRRGKLSSSDTPGNDSDQNWTEQGYTPGWYMHQPETEPPIVDTPVDVGDQSRNDAWYLERNRREAGAISDGYFGLDDLYSGDGPDFPVRIDRGTVQTFGYDGDEQDESPATYNPR